MSKRQVKKHKRNRAQMEMIFTMPVRGVFADEAKVKKALTAIKRRSGVLQSELRKVLGRGTNTKRARRFVNRVAIGASKLPVVAKREGMDTRYVLKQYAKKAA